MTSQFSDLEPTGGEGAIEMRETEGKSQGQIVRQRFFRHKGAMVGLGALIIVILLACTSIGIGPIPGWWQFGPNENLPLVNGGRPTLVMPWSGEFQVGEHPFGQDEIGRDTFARTMKGAQSSLIVMFVIGIEIGRASCRERDWDCEDEVLDIESNGDQRC